VAKILAKQFGATKNVKGYLVLDPHVRIIQGDGIDFTSTGEILQAVMDAGFSTDNIGFGMGGGLLQKLDRDTQKFAFKCSSVTVASKAYDVFKSPVTDPGKNSKKGILRLVQKNGKFVTVGESDAEPQDDFLQEVFYNGDLTNEQTFDEIRERAAVTTKVPVNA
jgi:nicotinamide phosphoribosyltransferase